ncbi:hypothetical protein [Oligella urethralis]|uniref:hypothetical protein n=1 Tax=Oligella urethralis TaxID=90245 RepID=UPI000E0F46F9|nr:hypothetical protein [Oligella urethralis]
MGEGLVTSLAFNQDYGLSNLAYDLTLGVFITKGTNTLINTTSLNRAEKRFVDIKARITNYFLSSGVSSAIGGTVLERKDTLIVEKQNLWQ